MFKNYIKIAWRSLLKSKIHSLINISGLAVGLASVLLISLYVNDELSYDKFHKNAEDIYRVAWWSNNPQTRTPHPMAQALVRDFPQVEAAVSLSPIWGPGLTKQTFSIRNLEKDITYDESGLLSVDSTFFDVFSFKLLQGNKDKVLRQIGGLLISQSMAQKYFGNTDPIGKQLAINDDKKLLTVEGVFEDIPVSSHFHFDMLISYVTMKAFEGKDSPYYSWSDFGHFNYIRLKPGSNPQALQGQLMSWIKSYLNLSQEDMHRVINEGMHFKLQPLTDIHLNSRIRWELEPNGNKEYVYIMTAAALLILVIACVNFMNLTTARSAERSKEIGIRKSLGAQKRQVSLQFLGESILTALFAMVLAGLLAEVFLPLFNIVTGKTLSLNYIEQPQLIATLIGSALLSGLIAGLYPSVFLSSVKPVISLKGIDKIKPKGAGFRKALMVFQFVISMVLLTGSLVIYHQLQFIQNKDLGFEGEQVIVVPLKNLDLKDQMNALHTELNSLPGVQSVSASSNVPGKQFNQNSISLANDPQSSVSSSEIMVDYDFFKTLSIPFAAGRAFSRDYPTDSSAFIINETAARNLGLEDPVGKEIEWSWDNGKRKPLRGTVIGVVKDFNFNSLHEPVRPLLFYLTPNYNTILVKVQGEHFQETIAAIEKVWEKFEDRFGFEYSVLADDMSQQYVSEKKTAKVFGGFSIVAILIACFGLFGIASLSYAQRAKEVGIRKVMGASVFKILMLLLKDFSILIVISIIISVPLGWYIMDEWLHNFTYRIDLSFDNFLIAGITLIGVALLTVSYLTIHTANRNPVDALKEE